MNNLPHEVLLELERRGRLDRLGRVIQAIGRWGSLNRAAEELGVSYRQAWGLIRTAEDLLGQSLLIRRTGGAEGGGAELTTAARLLVDVITKRQAALDTLSGSAAPGPDLPSGPAVVLASTIGPAETGLLDEMEAAYHRETGRWVRHIAAGSGQAFEIARSGKADLVLAHAPGLEKRFIDEGWGLRRLPLMRNDFILVGPPSDPLMIGRAADAAEAARLIASAAAGTDRTVFVSRGDCSGTHLKETELWAAAGTEPGTGWYEIFERGGQGSLATLARAAELGAYTLADRASYLSWEASSAGDLDVIIEGDPLLENPFALVLLNPVRLSQADHSGASAFAAWATGPGGQGLIAEFGVDGFGTKPYTLVMP